MKIFLSYSTEDHKYKDEIKKTFSHLEREEKVELWVDEKNLRGGDSFDSIIEKELYGADMVLLLLSREFWASDYIQTYEMPIVLKRHKEKELIVIPIVLRNTYDLTGHDEVKNIGALPRKSKPSYKE